MQPPLQQVQKPDPRKNGQGYRLWLLPIALILFFAVILWGGSSWDIFLLCGIILGAYIYLLPLKSGSPSPLLFLVFSPILLINQVSIGDFNIRLISFLLIGIICNYASQGGKTRFTINMTQKKPLYIWLTALLIFSSFAFTLYFQNIYLSGDEPHYIMMSQSLAEEGDLDLNNNMEQQTYRSFHPLQLNSHGMVHQKKLRPFHMPGLPVLLVPFYYIYQLCSPWIPSHLFFRLVAALLNSFFALSLFYLLKIKFPKKNISGWWLMFITLYPLAFHSLHLYPELPAAALLIIAYLAAIHGRKYWLCGLLLSLIPWFHLKYIPVILFLAVVLLVRLIKTREYQRIPKFLIFPVISGLCLIFYSKGLYGTLNPANIFPQADYLAIPLTTKIKTLFSYFLDQRDGLLLYSPIFIFLFMAGKSRLKERGVLWGMALTYIFFHAFSTLRGAYSPAARPLVFISWIFVLLIIDFGFQQQEAQKSLFSLKLTAGISYFILFWLFYHPLFIYQPVFSYTVNRSSDLLLFLGSDWLRLNRLFPSFLSTNKGIFTPNLVWIAGIFLLVSIFYFRKKIPFPVLSPKTIAAMVFLVLCLLFCFFPHIYLEPRDIYNLGNISIYNSSRNIQVDSQQSMLKVKGGTTYHLYLEATPSLPEKLLFQLHSAPGNALTIRNGKRLLYKFEPGTRDKFSLATATLKIIRVREKRVIHLGLECRNSAKDSFLKLQISSQ